MNAQNASVNVNDVLKEMTLEITITGMRECRIRLFIVMQLIRLIRMVAPYKIEVKHE